MSNIYIQEPPTSGKVLLITTVGEIDIELWCKECPKTCRNFIQLCMEGYYNNTVFHRVVPGFIAQGGDPNGDGTGGDSIYGEPFKDEFHQRLRYTRRGLVGMANSGTNNNASQFFFTMTATPELQNVNTLFAKVTGNTIFNMIKLEEGLVDNKERPLYLNKILSCEILKNPFTDIIPRSLKQTSLLTNNKGRKKGNEVKNFKLLSFGEEAAEDEDEISEFMQHIAGKAKSLHDVVIDPNLSKDTFITFCELTEPSENVKRHSKSNELEVIQNDFHNDEAEILIKSNKINKKLPHKLMVKSFQSDLKPKKHENSKSKKTPTESDNNDDDEDDVVRTQVQEEEEQNETKKKQIRLDIQTLKKSYQNNKREKKEILNGNETKERRLSILNNVIEDNEYIQQYLDTRETYLKIKGKIPKSSTEREAYTLNLLSTFRSKLQSLSEAPMHGGEKHDHTVAKDVEKDITTDIWLTHTLRFENATIPVVAKDASSKGDDWYDVTDPRNPINKRKRCAEKRKKESKKL